MTLSVRLDELDQAFTRAMEDETFLAEIPEYELAELKSAWVLVGRLHTTYSQPPPLTAEAVFQEVPQRAGRQVGEFGIVHINPADHERIAALIKTPLEPRRNGNRLLGFYVIWDDDAPLLGLGAGPEPTHITAAATADSPPDGGPSPRFHTETDRNGDTVTPALTWHTDSDDDGEFEWAWCLPLQIPFGWSVENVNYGPDWVPLTARFDHAEEAYPEVICLVLGEGRHARYVVEAEAVKVRRG